MNIKKTLLSLIAVLLSTILLAQNQPMIKINKDLELIHLQDSIFIHVSYHSLEAFGRFPSNGMFIIKKGEAVMIDTPMDLDKTKILVHFLQDSLNIKVKKLIVGHYHEDCMGGLEYLQSIGVESLAHVKTIEKCQIFNLPIPGFSFQKSIQFDFHGEEILCKYFGGGHTIDNITVYLPETKILYGGCLIKEMAAQNLGFTGDAVMKDWAFTVQKVMAAYPDIQYVVPGHGAYGGKNLLKHTIGLVQQEISKKQ